MVAARGQIWWVDLGQPLGSEPGFRRPIIVIQSDGFNRSALRTVVVASLTSNERLAAAPGNVMLPARATKLDRDSVVIVSQISTLDRIRLIECVSQLSPKFMAQVDDGLRLVLDI